MFSIHYQTAAVCLCVLTMLGWGSWANTLKLATRRGWPFELFYWDYILDMVLGCLSIALSFGSHGPQSLGALASLRAASPAALGSALLSGVLFNASNVLIVVATDLAGIAIAFPVAVGLAVVIGTAVTYWQSPTGHALTLFVELGMLLLAMVLAGWAAAQRDGREGAQGSSRGVVFAVLSGSIMGFFYPRLAAAIGDNTHPGRVTPYAGALIFCGGLLFSNVVINSALIWARGETYRRYVSSALHLHLFGIAGGVIWMVALCANLVAASVAGPAVSYALGQGATLLAAIWGVFIWREFRGCSRPVRITLACMFLSYTSGLVFIGSAAA